LTNDDGGGGVSMMMMIMILMLVMMMIMMMNVATCRFLSMLRLTHSLSTHSGDSDG
jgi:hypothetical protein